MKQCLYLCCCNSVHHVLKEYHSNLLYFFSEQFKESILKVSDNDKLQLKLMVFWTLSIF